MPGHVSEKELQTESLTGLGATTSPSMPRERQRDIENIEKRKRVSAVPERHRQKRAQSVWK